MNPSLIESVDGFECAPHDRRDQATRSLILSRLEWIHNTFIEKAFGGTGWFFAIFSG